jgi:hypothetical protein
MSEDLTRRRLFGLAGATAAGAAGLTASGCSAFQFGSSATNVRAVAAYSAGPPFRSRPDLTPPHITIRRTGIGSTSRYIFLNAPYSGPGHGGTYIIDPHGHFVWFGPNTASKHRLNFSVQSYQGQPVLTWFEGLVVEGFGQGDFVIANMHYNEIFRVKAVGGEPADFHEFTLTPRGTAYIPIYRRHSPVNLTARGGPASGYIVSGVAQEIDIATGDKKWEWDSWARSNPHVALSESHQALGGGDGGHGTHASPYNYFHINSICDIADGSDDVLISGRNCFCVYRVHKPTGRIVWRMGGRRNNFTYGSPRARFYWQHHVRPVPVGNRVLGGMTVFDNGVPHEPFSRALLLKVDDQRRHVELTKAFIHPHQTYASGAMGSAQLLPDGRMFVGWGTEPHFSEFAAKGTLLLDGDITKGDPSYRAFAQDWVGQPKDKPAAAARYRSGGATVYASWNGATAVRFWVVFAGRTSGNLHQIVKAHKNGFETAINVSDRGPYFAVHALDGKGNVLAKSAPVRIR